MFISDFFLYHIREWLFEYRLFITEVVFGDSSHSNSEIILTFTWGPFKGKFVRVHAIQEYGAMFLEHHSFLTSLLDKSGLSDCRAAVWTPAKNHFLLSEEEDGLAPEPFWTVWRKELYITTQAYGGRIHALKRWIQFQASSSQLSSSKPTSWRSISILSSHFLFYLPSGHF